MATLFRLPPSARPVINEDGAYVHFGDALITEIIGDDPKVFTTRQTFKKGFPATDSGRASITTPPYHWHYYQEETFHVEQGVMGYVLEGKEGKLTAGQSTMFKPGQRHTFWQAKDDSEDKDLIVRVSLPVDPSTGHGLDRDFLLNFYGYLNSCFEAKVQPSPFQMLLFLYKGDVALADPPLNIGPALNLVLGRVVGQGLLGFKTSYKEYSDSN